MVIDGGSGGGSGPARPSGGGSGGSGAGGSTRPRRAPRPTRDRRDRRVEQPQTVIRLPKNPYETDYPTPKARRGRGLLALAAVTVVVAAVITLSSHGSDKGGNGNGGQGASTGVGGGVPPATASTGLSAATGGAPVFPSQTGPNGVATGYLDTKDGAAAAATNYISAYVSESMIHADQRHAMIHAIADPAIESHLQSQLDTAFTAAAHGYGLDANGNPPSGQTLVYRGVPAGVQVQSYTKDKAVVAVWTCTIDGIAGQGSTFPVSATWSTLTVTLTWVNNDWRFNDFAQADGPTPVGGTQQASTAVDLQKAVEQFARLKYAP